MFGLSILSHFVYKWIPNSIFSILFPVNESIWEHMKLLVTPVLLFSLFEYIIYRKKNINFNNFLFSYAVSMVLGILIYLLIYLPIDAIFGHSVVVAIGLLFITFIIIQIISYYIMRYENINYSNSIGILIIIILYIIFGFFTYNPPYNDLFYDTEKDIYGIPQ